MFRSLRFQLPALFFAGVIVFGLVAAAIAFQLLQSYTLEPRARRPAARGGGLTRLYTAQASRLERPGAGASSSRTRPATASTTSPLDPGSTSSRERRGRSLRQLPKSAIDFAARRQAAQRCSSSSSRPGSDKTWLARRAAARPRRNGEPVFCGALVVAKPKDQLATRVVPLLERLALALLGGLIVARDPRRLTSPGG